MVMQRPTTSPSLRSILSTPLLLLALAALAACDHDDFDFINDDEPLASGRFTAQVVDDLGAGGHVELDFQGVFDPGGGVANDLAAIEVFVDSGAEAVSFRLDEDSGWDLTQRLGTITLDADYDTDDDRFDLAARLNVDDDQPRTLEARVRYRVRYFGSDDDRFDREYVWREQVDF